MEFQRRTITDPAEFLNIAAESEQYVRSFIRESEDGMYSAELTNVNKDNLYVGTAGILHMYIAMDRVFPDRGYRHMVSGLTRYLCLHAFDGTQIAKRDGEFVPGMAEAFYSGIGGIGLILNEVYRFYGDADAKAGSGRIIRHYLDTAEETDKGVCWTDNSPIFFDGGILLFLIDSINTYGDSGGELKTVVKKGADHILSHGQWHEDGGLELDHHHVDFKHKEPNFEFGTAGIGYLFAKVYEVLQDVRYLEAAKAAARYIKSIAVEQKKGYLIPYKLGKYENLFYLGNCHGPVGTAKLFYELFRITGERCFWEETIKLYDGAESLGAPFRQSAGFWNTTCICCGPAGYIPMCAGMYRADGDDVWIKRAHCLGELLAGTRKGLSWEIAFDRTKPHILSSPAGYFTGTAGMIESLLQVYCLENGIDLGNGLIDDPYLTTGSFSPHK